MRSLGIDIETYSSVDIKTSGAYAYVNSPDFEILLFAYAYDDEPVTVIDLTDFEAIPDEILGDLTNPDISKTAFNANFERTCLSRELGLVLPIEQWSCTAVQSLTLGLPGDLAGVSTVLKLPQDKAKMAVGKQLITYFCKPCKPTKSNGGRTRNLPHHAPAKWELFKQYCLQDVEAERAVRAKTARYKPLPEECRLWVLDQEMNDRGVKIDTVLAEQAIACDSAYQTQLLEQAVRLTGLPNPKSNTQLKAWLEEKGLEVESLDKNHLPGLLQQTADPAVTAMLNLKQELSKTSVKKYDAMLRATANSPDNRARGLLQFYGANRTGRWAGRLVQVQNLPKNTMTDLAMARELLKAGEYDLLDILFDSVSNVLSQLIRTAFIPEDGHRFIVADYSAIEARVIAWLANEKWRLAVFSGHGKIYEASAAQMFHVPLDSIDKHSPLRQKGKIAELALGYGGSVGALEAMGALKMGLDQKELKPLVTAWRAANPNIVNLWWDVDKAAITAVKEKTTVPLVKGISFSYEAGMLFIRLPSGRRLVYIRPKMELNEKFDRMGLTYEGMDQKTKQWGRIKTYGPKLVENIVQAIARDCLREALFWTTAAGYQSVMHVHDEIVIEAPKDAGSVEHVCQILSRPIPWASGLQLTADGYETDYYKKDD